MAFHILLERHIAQERNVGGLLNINTVMDSGVEHILEQQERHRNSETNQGTDYDALSLVRSDRIAVDIGIVDHLTRSLELRASHQQFLSLGQKL